MNMREKNGDLIDGTLSKIFEDREFKTEAFVVILDSAKKNSVGVSSVEKKISFEFVDLKKITTCVASIVLSALVIVGAVSYAKHSYSEMMEIVSMEIGSYLYETDKHISIVSKNTVRNGDIIYYNQEGIARDLLKLDSSLFEYAFCSVCNDMGNNIDNKVGALGKSNINAVIYYLKMFSNVDGVYFNENVSNALNGIETLDEYLIKNGFVDKAGNPSLEVFKKECDKQVDFILSMLQNDKEKGVNRS